MKESLIQNQILTWLTQRKIFVWRNNSVGVYDPVKRLYRKNMSKFSLNGTSDILGIIEGKLLAIEVKSETGRVSDAQKKFLNEVNAQGGVAFVARNVMDVEIELIKRDLSHRIQPV